MAKVEPDCRVRSELLAHVVERERRSVDGQGDRPAVLPDVAPLLGERIENRFREMDLRPSRILIRGQLHIAAVVGDFTLERDKASRSVREKIEPADFFWRLHDLETEIPGVGDRHAALSGDRKKIERAW